MNNNMSKSLVKSTTSSFLLKSVTHVFLIIWALIVLFPFYWMLLTSVKSYGAYSNEFIPKFFTLYAHTCSYDDTK